MVDGCKSKRGRGPGRFRRSVFHRRGANGAVPQEMAFFANLGVNLYGWFCGGLQAAAKTLDFLDIGQRFRCLAWMICNAGSSFRDENPSVSIQKARFRVKTGSVWKVALVWKWS